MAEGKSIKRSHQFKDIEGQAFGRVTVLRFAGTNNHNKALWECACQCGKICIITGSKLRSGATQSCGCLHGEKHQRSHCPEYKVWYGMIQRCHNPNDSAFVNYGGRGISVCDRWRHSFQNFASDMGNRPTPKHSIDRIDNGKNYCPENCRWATKKEQCRNKRTNRYLTINGETKILQEWADQYGVRSCLLTIRLKRGWPPEKAVTTPAMAHPRRKSHPKPDTSPPSEPA